jgi:hypothetical protein
MSRKSNWFRLLPAIILIPVLLGLTPLNFIEKMGSGCPFSHSKQISCNHCPFNSVVSHDDATILISNSIPSEQNLPDFYSFNPSELESHHHIIFARSLPLRC